MNAMLEKVPLFALILLRLGGFIVVAPMLSSPSINTKVKVFFTLSLALLLVTVLPGETTGGREGGRHFSPVYSSAWLAGMGLCEFAIGLVLGLGFRIAFSASSMAGECMGLQMGLGAAALYDPNTEQTVSPLEQLYSSAFLAAFVACDGPQHMLRALNESYVIAPLTRTVPFLKTGLAALPGWTLELLMAQTGRMLSCGCRMAAPVVLPLFLMSLAIALVSRAYPQMNMWSLSYGASILAGLILLGAALPGMQGMVQEALKEMDLFALRLLRIVAG